MSNEQGQSQTYPEGVTHKRVKFWTGQLYKRFEVRELDDDAPDPITFARMLAEYEYLKAEVDSGELIHREKVEALVEAARGAERVLRFDEQVLLASGFGWVRGIHRRLKAALADLGGDR